MIVFGITHLPVGVNEMTNKYPLQNNSNLSYWENKFPLTSPLTY